MRILIDEDTAVQLVDPLVYLLVDHQVAHVHSVSWKSKKDRHVLADAKNAGYHVFLTKDRSQLSDPFECAAIKKSGLHHIRYAQRVQGKRGLALAMGAIIAAGYFRLVHRNPAEGKKSVPTAASSSSPKGDSSTLLGSRLSASADLLARGSALAE